jgi:hypothetical protein
VIPSTRRWFEESTPIVTRSRSNGAGSVAGSNSTGYSRSSSTSLINERGVIIVSLPQLADP